MVFEIEDKKAGSIEDKNTGSIDVDDLSNNNGKRYCTVGKGGHE
jgi:hypothetical protein